MEINLREKVNCLIGTNNVGKSNIMKSLNFFYVNLTKEMYDESMFSKSNPYNDELEITVEFDLTDLINKTSKIKSNSIFDFFEPTNELFEKIDYYSEKYSRNNKVLLSLKYNKNRTLVWNIEDYEFRSFISLRFPIFFLESRDIDLYNWDSIWGVIGSIAPFRQKININQSIKGVFGDSEEDNYQKVIESILDIFEKSDIKIQRTHVFEKISQIIQLQIGGKNFNYDTHSLKIGSYGMNSYTYMKLYINIILKLFEYKHFATPLIMLDEPELHLHMKKIEEFVRGIREQQGYNKTKWIFSTHSPAFAKNIILENEKYSMFHITNNSMFNKTCVTKINGFKQKKYKLLTDNEASLFFSEVCLFVEGDTEMELFKNKYIKLLFPKISKVDIYSFDGKDDKLQLVNPSDRKSKIKYLVLLDLDKLLSYSPKTKRFSITGSDYLNVMKDEYIKKRERYHYKSKFIDTFVTRNQIMERLKNNRYEIDSTGLCFQNNQQRIELIELIQRYYVQYNFFPLETTIEGALINDENYEIFYEWLTEHEWNDAKFKNLYNQLESEIQKTSFFRVIFFGKTHWLNGENESKKKDDANKNNDFLAIFEQIKEIRSELKKTNIDFEDKTSGWVTLFINWFFEKKLTINKTEDLFLNRNIFISKFTELGNVIVCLEKML
jgi:predicted ATP-dependent endonuclease of OLD family